MLTTDVDECERDPTACDKNALCSNTDGSYKCTCKDGYRGNGINCTGNGSIEEVGGKWWDNNGRNKTVSNLSIQIYFLYRTFVFTFYFLLLLSSFLFNPPHQMPANPALLLLTGPLSKTFSLHSIHSIIENRFDSNCYQSGLRKLRNKCSIILLTSLSIWLSLFPALSFDK